MSRITKEPNWDKNDPRGHEKVQATRMEPIMSVAHIHPFNCVTCVIISFCTVNETQLYTSFNPKALSMENRSADSAKLSCWPRISDRLKYRHQLDGSTIMFLSVSNGSQWPGVKPWINWNPSDRLVCLVSDQKNDPQTTTKTKQNTCTHTRARTHDNYRKHIICRWRNGLIVCWCFFFFGTGKVPSKSHGLWTSELFYLF